MNVGRLIFWSKVSLGWCLLVIVWGAFVRATGSGAGCGDHWPLCNGDVVPLEGGLKTAIEFSHRLTSGICLLLVLFVAWLVKKYTKKDKQTQDTSSEQQSFGEIRKLAFWSVVFIFLEAAIGAGIVLFKLVEFDASLARGITLSLHLVNTFLLLFCQIGIVLKSQFPELSFRPVWNKRLLTALGAIVFVSVSGGIAALGSTVFPESKYGGVSFDLLEETKHMFVRLRGIHPFAAIATSTGIVFWCYQLFSKSADNTKLNISIFCASSISLLQLFLGVLNIYLKAPVYMQLVHLFFADVLFLSVVCVLFFSATNNFNANSKTTKVKTNS